MRLASRLRECLSSRVPTAACWLLLAFLLVPRPAFAQRSVSGTVTVQGPSSSAVPLTFDFCATDRPLFFSRTLTPSASGAFTITDVPPAQYTLAIKGSKWLRAFTTPAVNTTTANVTGLTASLPAGDANNDNKVNDDDLTILSNAFNTTPGQAAWDPRADFNNDNSVDIYDLGLLSDNYGRFGAVYATNLRASGGTNQINLTWQGSSGAVTYNVYRAAAFAGPFTTPLATRVPSPSYTHTAPPAGTNYYQVAPVDSSGTEGARSNVAGSAIVTALVDTAQPAWAEDIIPTHSPASSGFGPSSATSIDVSSGVLENRPGADIDAYNAVGLSPSFARLYRSAQAARSYGSPGMTAGWTHNYDLRVSAVTSNGWGNLQLTYPNGATEIWQNSSIPANGVPTGLTPQTPGTPYRVVGLASAGNGYWGSLTLTYKDRTALVFEPTADPNLYRLTQMKNAVGSTLYIHYYADGRLSYIENDDNPRQTLLQCTYNGSLLYQVSDVPGSRNVTYTFTPVSGVNTLQKVSQINSSASAWEYQYQLVSGWPLLTKTGVPDPTANTSTILFNNATLFDTTGAINEYDDAKGNRSIFHRYGGFTEVEQRRSDGTLDLNWIQTYDSSGANTGGQDAFGYVGNVLYGSGANPKKPTLIINRNGQISEIEYDSFGNVTRVKTPFKDQQLVSEFTYLTNADYPTGRLSSTREGNLTLGEYKTPTNYTYYDGATLVDGILQPKGLLQRITGPVPGDPTSGSGVTSLMAEYAYMARGNLYKVTLPAPNSSGGTVTYQFSYTTDPYTNTANARPERMGQPTRVIDPQGRGTFYDYDARGNVIYVKDGIGFYTNYEYNTANQLSKIILPADVLNGSSRVYLLLDYLAPGKALSQVTLFNAKAAPYDGSGTIFQRMRKGSDNEDTFQTLLNDTLQSSRAYDALGRTKQFQDGRFLNPTSLTYDAVGNPKQLNLPGNTGGDYDSLAATFDPEGNPLTRRDGLSRVTTITRDARDSRTTGIVYPTGATGTRPNVTYTHDDFGRLHSVADGIATQTFSYDDLDNVTRVDTVYTDIPGQPTLSVSYAFFPDGSRSSMTTPAGVYSYTYNNAGQLLTTTTPWSAVITNHYRPNGWLDQQNTPITRSTYTSNGRGLTTQVRNFLPDGTDLSNYSGIAYDAAGNRKQVTVAIPRVGAAASANGSLTYSYDTLSRLTGEGSVLDNPTITNLYTPGYPLLHQPDAANNLTTVRGLPLSYTGGDNQIDGNTYDGNGNPSTFFLSSFLFDIENQLKQATINNVAAFTAEYFADGRRAWKQSNNQRFYYLYDGDTVICELNASGVVSNAFGYGASGLSMRRAGASGSAYFAYTYDPQGSLAQRHPSSAVPNVSDFTAFYDGFGSQRSQVSAQLGNQYPSPDMVGYRGQFGAWTDNETDPVSGTGLHVRYPSVWTGERYYDPGTARFLTREINAAGNYLAPVENPYAGDPNPLGHTLGNVLAGVAGGIVGGPLGSSIAIGAWEAAYSYALGSSLETALTHGVVDGVVSFGVGKAFELGASVLGATVRKIWQTRPQQFSMEVELAVGPGEEAFEYHHLLPREFRSRFTKLGLKIDDWTMRLEADFHQNYIHGMPKDFYGGQWNREWRVFWIELERKALKTEMSDAGKLGEVMGQLEGMLDRYGIRDFDIVEYPFTPKSGRRLPKGLKLDF